MNQTELQKLSRSTSRRATLLSGIGALVTITAFVLAIFQLNQIETKVRILNQYIETKNNTLVSLNAEISGLNGQLTNLQVQLEKYKRINHDLDNAFQLQLNRQYNQSLEILEGVLKLDSSNEYALYWKAHVLYRLGKYDDSIKTANLLIETDKSFLDPYLVLVFDLNKVGRQAEALNYLETALNLNIDSYNQFAWRKDDYDVISQVPAIRDVFARHLTTLELIQQKLKNLGYYQGKIDGWVGDKTMTALNNFYNVKGITNNPSINELKMLLQITNN